jgi:hypothetical protein
MLVNLPFLFLAIVLLWFPRRWMRHGFSIWNRRKRRTEDNARKAEEPWKTDEPGNPAVRFGAEFSKLRNYVDALRTAAGSVALLGGFDLDPCIDVVPDATGMLREEVLGLKLAILLVGLLIQTVRYERQRLLFFAPIFYLFGLTVGLCEFRTAAFSFALIWAVNPMLQNPGVFLSVYALIVGGFGAFFIGATSQVVIAAVLLCFLPVLLSLLAQRPLVLFTRKGTRTFGDGTV